LICFGTVTQTTL